MRGWKGDTLFQSGCFILLWGETPGPSELPLPCSVPLSLKPPLLQGLSLWCAQKQLPAGLQKTPCWEPSPSPWGFHRPCEAKEHC